MKKPSDLAKHALSRRTFLLTASALSGSSLLALSPMAAAEPPPEITRLRIHENEVTCIAPQVVARDLLYGEGFTDVRYVNFPRDIQHWPPEDLLADEVDITLSFTPTDIRFLDSGASIAILAAAHTGCVELIARRGIRSIRELKGKTAAVDVTDTKIFISLFAAYVGVNPEKDINWVTYPAKDWVPLLSQGKIDAFMAGPPLSLEVRHKGLGHVLASTTDDKPWSQYSCCLVAATKEFVRRYPVATKRALRAILKGVDLCASEPNRVARVMVDQGLASYDTAMQVLRDLPFGRWREIDVADSLRFWSLRMRDVGAIKSSPQKIIAEGMDLRFLNELKRELKT
jgi:NitT/TauT family transport system substrate-binding protein